MGKFVTDINLRVKNNYLLYFKNLNFNFVLSSKINFIKKIHILQNLLVIRCIVSSLNNITPVLAVYINTTISSSVYYHLKSYLLSNFFKILCSSYNMRTKFKVFFLVYCMHSNIFYLNDFIAKILEISLFNYNTYFSIFIEQNLVSISWYDQLFVTSTLLKKYNVLVNKLELFIWNRLFYTSGSFLILKLLFLFYYKYFNFINNADHKSTFIL
jgi:hypothetical protein